MSSYYIDKGRPYLGVYTIWRGPEGYRWGWEETARGMVYKDYGKWFGTEAEALRDAADDWDACGDSSNRRFSGMLRGLAKRAESA